MSVVRNVFCARDINNKIDHCESRRVWVLRTVNETQEIPCRWCGHFTCITWGTTKTDIHLDADGNIVEEEDEELQKR